MLIGGRGKHDLKTKSLCYTTAIARYRRARALYTTEVGIIRAFGFITQVRATAVATRRTGGGPVPAGRIPDRPQSVDTETHEEGVPKVQKHGLSRVQDRNEGNIARDRVANATVYRGVPQGIHQVQVVHRQKGRRRLDDSKQREIWHHKRKCT